SGFYVAQNSNRGGDPNQSFSHLEAASGAVDAPGSVRAITEFGGATYIATFGRGVERFEEGRTKRVWPVNAGEHPEAISLSPDGNQGLLIGTTNGVLVFDGQAAKTNPTFDSFKDSTVRSIQQSKDGALWFATSNGVFFCPANGVCIAAAPGVDARDVA